MIEKEKKYLASWWMWLLGLVVLSSIILGVLKYVGMIGTTVVERVIFENSYQKVAADKKANNVYSAQLAEIEYKLSGNIDAQTRQDLNAQAAMLRVQRNSVK